MFVIISGNLITGSVNYSPNKSTNNSTHMASPAPVETVTAGSRRVPGFVLPGSSEDSGDILPCLAADVNSGEEGDGDSSGNEGEGGKESKVIRTYKVLSAVCMDFIKLLLNILEMQCLKSYIIFWSSW